MDARYPSPEWPRELALRKRSDRWKWSLIVLLMPAASGTSTPPKMSALRDHYGDLILYVERFLQAKVMVETFFGGGSLICPAFRHMWPLASLKYVSRAAAQRHALEGALD